MSSLELRIREMEAAGIDRQVISLPMPGTDPFDRDFAIQLAREANDDLAELSRTSKVLSPAATVPLSHPDSAVEELERVVSEHGTRMVEIFSNVAGRPLDSDEFLRFFRKAASLGVSILVHPCRPLMMNNVREYGLAGAVGFVFDTTLAILRLVHSGIYEKLPELKLIIPHIGGTFPYLVGRIDHQYRLLPDHERAIPKPPGHYLKRVYIDTAQSLHKPAMQCAFDSIDAERILFGTDYPFVDLKASVASIEALCLPKDVEDKVFGGNAKALGII
jgi:predicted TIM-barrel fold metal-dependent hydrolase